MPKRKKRSDGRYSGKLYLGNGKYKYVYGKSDNDVKNKLAELRVALNKGVDLSLSTSFSFWADRWLAREKQRMTPEWFSTCASRANVWREYLGDESITDLTTADLEDVLLSLQRRNPATGKPSSKKTLTEYRNIIARIYAIAVQNRVITFDPTQYITIDKTAKTTKRNAITDDQIRAISETPHEAQLACLIMIYAGLRLGELAALTWSDVDLINSTINVNKSYNFKSGQIKSPKTAAGTRTVPIPPPLAQILNSAPHISIIVCPHKNRAYTMSAWRNAAASYSRILGFDVRAHSLRHTCCTLYYEAGIDVLTAQRWMGHADPSTTMSIYTHLRESHEKNNVSKLADFYNNGCQMGVSNNGKTIVI